MKAVARIRRLEPDTPEAELAARWRYEAFFADSGDTFEESRRDLFASLGQQGYEIGLLAEIDAKHDLTPWLAALYVAPDFRRQAIGRALVKAIEDHARSVGTEILHLYTIEAEAFYAKLGWVTRERFDWHGDKMVLMVRTLTPGR